MGLSREERRALDEMAKRLARDDPDLDAVLSGSAIRAPRPGASSSTTSSLLQVWFMLVLITCAIFMIGMVMLLTAGERSCTGLRSKSCTEPSATAGR
jgi:hypothetical protein